MSNTSASGGYLLPSSSPPPADAAMDDVLTALVSGITGLLPSLVRPRWQATPPKRPERTTDWCAVGVTRSTPDANAYTQHHPDGNGYDETQRHETLEVTASFYGPGAYGNAGLLRDGLAVAQNREALFLAGFGFVESLPAVNAPDYLNETWISRVDQPIILRHQIGRTYPVQNLLSAVGEIVSDVGERRSEPFDTANVRG